MLQLLLKRTLQILNQPKLFKFYCSILRQNVGVADLAWAHQKLQ